MPSIALSKSFRLERDYRQQQSLSKIVTQTNSLVNMDVAKSLTWRYYRFLRVEIAEEGFSPMKKTWRRRNTCTQTNFKQR